MAHMGSLFLPGTLLDLEQTFNMEESSVVSESFVSSKLGTFCGFAVQQTSFVALG